MRRYTYLYENRMFTNKVRHSIILGQKEKALGVKRKVLALIKSLCKSEKMCLGRNERSIKVDQNCMLIQYCVKKIVNIFKIRRNIVQHIKKLISGQGES